MHYGLGSVMSTSLDTPTNDTRPALPQDFVQKLLFEQAQLSAVDQFSARHDEQNHQQVNWSEPAQARYYKSLLPATGPTDGQQYSFEVDLDACSGCKACVVACHTLNGLEEEESWRNVGTITLGSELPQVKHVTAACHHCVDPGCLNGCPVKAYEKDPISGIVKHLDDQCIGCKYCTMMCPYEVPVFSERLGIVRKCDMCQQRLSAGEAPACVQSCPNEAIAIRLVDTNTNTYSAEHRLSPGAPPSTITHPTTRYLSATSDLVAQATPQDAGIDHPAESHWPLAVMLVLTQVSVGILFAERLLVAAAFIVGKHAAHSTTTFYAAVLAFGFAALGLGIAPLHLGQPTRAWRILLGLRTSWLSREALLFGLYMGCLALAIGAMALNASHDSLPMVKNISISPWSPDLLLTLALGIGTLGLLSSAMIYIVTSRRLWRSSRTLVRFCGSGLAIGPLCVGILTLQNSHIPFAPSMLLSTTAIILTLKINWEWNVLLSLRETAKDTYDDRSRRLVRSKLELPRYVRLVCGVMSISFALLATLIATSPWNSLAIFIAFAAIFLAIAGEIAERILYFASVVYDRMPGVIQ